MTIPSFHNLTRSAASKSAVSAKRSTRISRAPSKAAFASGTLTASTPSAAATTFTYLTASCSGSSVGSANSASASGSSPASRAICALVRRLGLNGRYISSTACFVAACSIARRSSSVSLPCSSIDPRIVCRRSSSSRRYSSRSSNVRRCVSSRLLVASLRYRAMKGTVAPPSSSVTAADTCGEVTPISWASRSTIRCWASAEMVGVVEAVMGV